MTDLTIKQFGSDKIDQALDIFVDKLGNVYLTGFMERSLPDNKVDKDFFIAKYDQNGTQVLLKQSGKLFEDIADSISVDNDGNIYLVGNTKGILGNRNYGNTDFFIAKYDSTGTPITAYQFGSFFDDEVKGFQVDSRGNFYLTGYTEGSLNGINNGGRDAWVAKYDSSGEEIWLKQFGTSNDDIALDLVLDDNNNIYLTGYQDLGAGSYNGWIAKYQNNGTLAWKNDILDNNNLLANGYTKSITIDEKGNIYAAGLVKEKDNPNSFDVLLTRFTPDGNQVWLTPEKKVEQIASEGYDTAESITVNSQGNIIISGHTLGYLGLENGANEGGFDAFVLQYGPNGTKLSIEQEKYSTNGDDFANAITVNNLNQIYVAGATSGNLESENQGAEDIWVEIPDPGSLPSDTRIVSIRDVVADNPDLYDYKVSPNQVFTVYLDLNNAAGLLSADFVLDYDANLFTLYSGPAISIDIPSLTPGEDISNGELILVPDRLLPTVGIGIGGETILLEGINLGTLTADNNWYITANHQEDKGKINFSVFGSNPLPISSGSLVELNFLVAPDAPSNVESPLTLSSVSLNENGFETTVANANIFIQPDILQVDTFAFTPNNTGFEVTFPRSLNPYVLNLYSGPQTAPPPFPYGEPDVILTAPNGNNINGSLLLNESLDKITFVATGGLLEAGEYQVTLISGSSAFVSILGSLLDGNGDGTPGDNYTTSFTITETGASDEDPLTVQKEEVALILPDFSRGPSQIIDVPANDLNTGLPISLETNQEVNSVEFSLIYNPETIKINGVNLNDKLFDQWTINSDLATSGIAKITLSGNNVGDNLITENYQDLLFLDAEVLPTAVYNSTDLIEITDVLINNNTSIKTVGDRAVHQVTYLGDVTGNGSYSGLDQATLNSLITVDYVTGFDAFPRIDPVILGDVTEDQTISGLDSSLILRAGLGIFDREIPLNYAT